MKTNALDPVELRKMIAEARELAETAEAGDLPTDAEPIQGREEAGRLMWAVHFVEDELAQLAELYDNDIAKLQAAKTEAIKSLQSSAKYLRDRLTAWHRFALTEDPTQKTIKMPGGKLASTAGAWTIKLPEPVDQLDAVALAMVDAGATSPLTKQPLFKIDRSKFAALIDFEGKHPDRMFAVDGDAVIHRETGQKLVGVTVSKKDRTHRVEPARWD